MDLVCSADTRVEAVGSLQGHQRALRLYWIATLGMSQWTCRNVQCGRILLEALLFVFVSCAPCLRNYFRATYS